MIKKHWISIVGLMFLAFWTCGSVLSVRYRYWAWAAAFLVLAALEILAIYKTWPEPAGDDDLNKTKDLRDTWDDKL